MLATYDIVERRDMLRVSEKKKVKQQIVKAIENIHKETKNTVAVNGEEIAKF